MLNKIKNKIYNLLRWSEKWTKTDMVYLASGGFWLTAGQVISSISSFLLAIAFANLLPKETYGIYKYVLSATSILAIPTLSGINTAVTQAISRGYEGSFIPALKIKLKWGTWGALASVLLAGYYYLNGNNTLTISFLISAVFVPLIESFAVFNSLLNGKKEFKLIAKYNSASQIASVFFIFIVLLFTNNLFIILLVFFASWTLTRLIFLKICLNKFKLNNNKDSQTIFYGKHLSLMNVLGIISIQIDKILIFHYLGAIELAIYAFALAPVDQLRNIIKNIQPLAVPKFASQEKKFNYKNYLKKLLLMIIILFILTVLYIIFAPIMYKIVFSKYLDSVKYSQYISLSLIASIAMLNYSFLRAQSAKKELYKLSIIIPIVQIVFTSLGVIYFGLFGVIWSQILIKTIDAIYSTFLTINFQKSHNQI